MTRAFPFGTSKHAQLLMRRLKGAGKKDRVGTYVVHLLANRAWVSCWCNPDAKERKKRTGTETSSLGILKRLLRKSVLLFIPIAEDSIMDNGGVAYVFQAVCRAPKSERQGNR